MIPARSDKEVESMLKHAGESIAAGTHFSKKWMEENLKKTEDAPKKV